jgi:hypothetical protein
MSRSAQPPGGRFGERTLTSGDSIVARGALPNDLATSGPRHHEAGLGDHDGLAANPHGLNAGRGSVALDV